jgi:hypothetical protein
MVKQRGGYRAGAGRPRKELAERVPRQDGKLAAWLPTEDMALAQRLMLHFPEVKTIDDLFSFAIHRLAATTDD